MHLMGNVFIGYDVSLIMVEAGALRRQFYAKHFPLIQIYLDDNI